MGASFFDVSHFLRRTGAHFAGNALVSLIWSHFLRRTGAHFGWKCSSSKVRGEIRAVPSFMDLALREARAAQAADEVPVGCVIVRDGRVLAAAGNRTLRDRDPTAHAEMLAIRTAAAALGSERLVDCDLYVTLEPCPMCAAAISFARIRRLYYGAADPKGGAVESGVRYFSSATCHHRPEIYGGIGETDAAGLLRAFFAARR
jgi:tRNA(adenine34) deaminase